MDSKEKKSKELIVGYENVENIFYFQLFRYSTIKEKIMIFIAIISSLIQGSSIPLMIYNIGGLMESFISLVINISIKKITGIDDENILSELVSIIISNKNENKEDSYVHFSNKYSDINLPKVMIIFICFIFHFLYIFKYSSRQTTRIRSLVFKSLIKQEIAWHEKTSPGELSSRIVSDSLLIEEGIGIKIGILVQNLCNFTLCFIIAFLSDWKLSLYISIIIPALIIFVTGNGIVISKYAKKSQEIYGVVGGIAQEAFSQIRTIASFGNEQKEIDRYVNKLKPTRKYGIIQSHAFGLCLGFISFCVYISYGIAFFKGAQFVNDGWMSGGDVMKVFMGISLGAMNISGCGNILNVFGEATGAAAKLFHIIERKPRIDSREGKCPESQQFHGEVEFKGVHFSYPSRPEVEILKGVSFRCHPGQTVALVGASGSGKSTIVQLLERYYLKSKGDILIDGKPIEYYNIPWLRSQIGIVSQEPTLFDMTIAENISISCPNATQEQIENAAKLANAHDFITKLPHGYQTKTGERGLQLSGGQKQRICIARALMINPNILFLDEATSALDNQSEKVVQAALESASSGRSTLVIAHRLSTVKDADLIVVMDKGVIVESGTHDELMAKEDIYYNLVKNQEMNTMDSHDKLSSSGEEYEENNNDDVSNETNTINYWETDDTCTYFSTSSYEPLNKQFVKKSSIISNSSLEDCNIITTKNNDGDFNKKKKL
eukprot:jgi/Orpsp1_1/1184933/evm.model.c7180000091640.2